MCLDLVKLAPVYFKLGRYFQAKQVYDIANGSQCMVNKAAEAASLLNRALGQLAARHDGDPARTWEEEDGIYETLDSVTLSKDTDQIFSRRLRNMVKRYGEVSKLLDGAPDAPRFAHAYANALSSLVDFFERAKKADQVEATYRLAFDTLNLTKNSTDLDVFARYASLLESYGTLLTNQQKPDEAAKVNAAAKDLRAKQAEFEKKTQLG